MCHFAEMVECQVNCVSFVILKGEGKCVIMLGWRSDRVIVSAL